MRSTLESRTFDAIKAVRQHCGLFAINDYLVRRRLSDSLHDETWRAYYALAGARLNMQCWRYAANVTH